MYRCFFVIAGMFCWLLFLSAKPAGENRETERKLALAFGDNKYAMNAIVKFELKRQIPIKASSKRLPMRIWNSI